jgi:pyruvate ferredoxin oxidoreductase delta subunit
MATVSIEVVYRGVFQKNLARNICRGIVLAARKEGKVGAAFGRYSDSPERNGIPAKQFAVVADSEEELEASLSRYEPSEVDITICLDDTLCKGLESWGWNGLQPVNKLVKENGTLLVTSLKRPEELLQHIHRKDSPYDLVVLRQVPSFSGLWVFKDDHSDVRVLGALAHLSPRLVSLPSLEAAIREQWRDEAKVSSARSAPERLTVRKVEPGEGNPEEPYTFQLLKWWEMEEALVVKGVPQGGGFRGEEGGFQPARNPHFKKYTTRSMRPIVDFERCTKCTLCWLHCPDGSFDVTPEGLYDVNLESCCGCAICEAVCPVKGCIVMVNEALFADNGSQYEMWKRDKEGYRDWFKGLAETAKALPRAHGFHHKGQYREEIAQLEEVSR